MKLNKMTKEELEQLSYTKIAEEYLKENKIKMNTASLFKEVCNLLSLDENIYKDKIADFFENLTTAKEFILLPDGNWDLKANHSVKIAVDEIYDDDIEIEEREELPEDEEENIDEEENYDDITDDNFEDDELSDLSIVNEDEVE